MLNAHARKNAKEIIVSVAARARVCDCDNFLFGVSRDVIELVR